MGYKTELQSNNADLQTILNKVNALPEAGGGGGGSVETCTVTFRKGSSMTEPGMGTGTVYYSDGNGAVKNTLFNIVNNTTITVIKNSIIYVSGGWSGTISTATNATLLYSYTAIAVYSIENDAVLKL